MFQFLKYLLHKQIIEMCHSQNLRRPLSVPCPTQCAHQNYCEAVRSSGLVRFTSITHFLSFGGVCQNMYSDEKVHLQSSVQTLVS